MCVCEKSISMQLTNVLLNASDSMLEKKESIHFDKRKIDVISRFWLLRSNIVAVREKSRVFKIHKISDILEPL